MRDSSGVKYFHSDHLGSAILTTDSNGSVYHQVRYNPYGSERWNDGNPAPSDYNFIPHSGHRPGQRRDGFGLLDYNARYFDASLGRFISPDTVACAPNGVCRITPIRRI